MNRTGIAKEILSVIIDELNGLISNSIKEFSKSKNIEVDDEELSNYVLKQVNIIPEKKEKVRVVKKKAITPALNDVRCQARTWNDGNGGQCIHRFTDENSKLCTHHFKAYKQNNSSLRHGFIYEPRPKHLFKAPSTRTRIT